MLFLRDARDSEDSIVKVSIHKGVPSSEHVRKAERAGHEKAPDQCPSRLSFSVPNGIPGEE